MQQEMSDEVLREHAAARVKQKRDFYGHLLAYVAVNAMLVVIWWLSGGGYPWFLWPAAIWGIFVVVHAIQVVFMPEAGSGFERQVDAEVERMRRAGHAH
jgi:cobalamin biosynthesis protein CobD/CbiB